MVFGLATMFVFYALLALQRWRWAVLAGYPTWVVLDVLCDTGRDAGNLINGTSDFAFVAGPTRRSLLVMRRARLLVQVLAAIVALIGVARWVTGWLRGGGSDAMQAVAALWAYPLLFLFVAYFLVGLPEWRVRRRERQAPTHRPSGERVPPLRGELVKMWMASAERARKSLAEDATGQG
jgi:hypothetical protein